MDKDTENFQLSSVNYQLPSPPPEAHYTVYRLIDPEGKVYIGCTGQKVKDRWKSGSCYQKQNPIRKAIDEKGWKNFKKEILCEKLTKAGAEKLERWFIAYYDSSNPEKGYNRALGGLGKGVCMCETTKMLNSIVKKRMYQKDPGYRARLIEGHRRAYSEDPDLRERVRKGVLKAYENDPNYWKKVSSSKKRLYAEHPEKREYISRVMREYLSKPENRAFINSDSRAKPVICVETGDYYPSQKAAEKTTGLGGIHKVCAGKRFTAGGFHWRYAEAVD